MKNWILAIRPKTMLASIGPVILGLSLAYYHAKTINLTIALLTLLCAVLLQFSTNIANDYLDFKKGIDTSERIGPVRVTQAGLISEKDMKIALILLLSLAFLTGCYLMYSGGIYIVIIGLLSLYFSYGYTGGPFPLSYHGLGEISAIIFFGLFAVSGTSFLQTHQIHTYHIIFGFSVGLISAAILAINNLRDINTDLQTNKRTLAVRIGEKNQRRLIIICMVTPIFINFVMAFITKINLLLISPVLLLPFLSTIKKIARESIGPQFNLYLANTAKYLLLYSLFVSLSLVIYS
jgi:1,4-dihydroxy-2-naphthoate octaprenyltransferase